MNESTTVAAVPAYVELAAVASEPAAGTPGALLRDYLAILAFHFDRAGASRSITDVDAALSTLPGLLLQATLQTRKSVSVTSRNVLDGLAEILANEWGAVANSTGLLSLVQPLTAKLGSPRQPTGTASLEVTLIVLQRPASGSPALGRRTLAFNLEQDDTAPTQPAWTGAASSKPPLSLSLSVSFTDTTYTVVDSTLAESQAFVSDLRRKGLLADLGATPGYLAIPLN
jgi:hypothetical protein